MSGFSVWFWFAFALWLKMLNIFSFIGCLYFFIWKVSIQFICSLIDWISCYFGVYFFEQRFFSHSVAVCSLCWLFIWLCRNFNLFQSYLSILTLIFQAVGVLFRKSYLSSWFKVFFFIFLEKAQSLEVKIVNLSDFEPIFLTCFILKLCLGAWGRRVRGESLERDVFWSPWSLRWWSPSLSRLLCAPGICSFLSAS
jgi:hypothetical protein